MTRTVLHVPLRIASALLGKLADRAKFRSKHNTYMVIPVVFMMISNHYPVAIMGHQQNWVILSVLTLVGWGVAHIIRKQ